MSGSWLELDLAATSGPAVSGTAPQDSDPWFATGAFNAATGSASATGSPPLLTILLVAGAVWLLLRKRGG